MQSLSYGLQQHDFVAIPMFGPCSSHQRIFLEQMGFRRNQGNDQ